MIGAGGDDNARKIHFGHFGLRGEVRHDVEDGGGTAVETDVGDFDEELGGFQLGGGGYWEGEVGEGEDGGGRAAAGVGPGAHCDGEGLGCHDRAVCCV